MFQTKYKRLEVPEEKNSGELLVEQDYISTEKQILSMIHAGERLRIYRKECCDLQDDEEEFILDPTREPNFDLADATNILNNIRPKEKEEVLPGVEPGVEPGRPGKEEVTE
jgi:hypothetical protein